MRIYVMSVMVDDQTKALSFYTEKLGFIVKHDIPMGEHRWLTVGVERGAGRNRTAARAERAPCRRAVQIRAGERRHSGGVLQGG